MAEEKNYKNTLNLPQTDFSMKADLAGREPGFIKRWEEQKIYSKILESRKDKKPFVLHDGPPYANGHLHSGHALNKTLKDMIVKSRTMEGRYSPYIPGWDCHGLPIEHQVMKNLGPKAKTLPLDEVRKECRTYAKKFVEIQAGEFKRLGVFGDFENPYLTLSLDYEADILEVLGKLLEKEFVYKGLKPVYWCGHCQTALADAEVEYHDHKSPSIYVKFPVKSAPFKTEGPLSVLIWTTTPWTLPANVAVAFNPDFHYEVVKAGEEYLILAKEMIQKVSEATGLSLTETLTIGKKELEALEIQHPFLDRESKPVFGSHVTLEAGTGVVHTAPGHGQEDFEVGLLYNLSVLSPVDHQARFTQEGGEWAGMPVFEANPLIIEKLKSLNRLAGFKELEHSYFHCWRCKKPVIYRATPQWFISVEKNNLRKNLLEAAEKSIEWIPAWGKTRMSNMLESRPDWCISRQRSWGVPIPALTCSDCGKTLLTPAMIQKVADIVRKEGLDIWFSKPASYFFGEDFTCSCGSKKLEKEGDILDVWFDSGVSWYAVLKRRGLPDADLYLEGSDQHRGWFQSSLIPSMAVQGKPPYRQVLTHGFLLDEQGKAMSKSAGNGIAPEEIIKQYGADILRLWVTTQDYTEDMRLGKNLLNQTADAYRKIRNTLRFILGNLKGFEAKDRLPYSQLNPMDQWALSRFKKLAAGVRSDYDAYRFNSVYKKLYSFTNLELSAFYLDVLKDLLYTAGKKSKARLSSLTVLDEMLSGITRLMAPILAFTAEDVWQFYRPESPSVHLEHFPDPEDYPDFEAVEKDFEAMIALREDALKALEQARTSKLIKASLEACIELEVKDPALLSVLKKYEAELPVYFIVSEVKLSLNAGGIELETEKAKISVKAAQGSKCPRCWKHKTDIGSHQSHPEVCGFCAAALDELEA